MFGAAEGNGYLCSTKLIMAMENEDKCCGNCIEFLYEDTDGVGWCRPNERKTYCGCGDKCHLHNYRKDEE